MRETSIDAWYDIQGTGVLGSEQRKVYVHLYKHGPLTGRELNAEMGRPDMHKRLSELERYGVVAAKDKRECKITGRLVLEWDVTSSKPVKPPPAANGKRSKPLLELLYEACTALEETGDMFAAAKAKDIRAAIRGEE